MLIIDCPPSQGAIVQHTRFNAVKKHMAEQTNTHVKM